MQNGRYEGAGFVKREMLGLSWWCWCLWARGVVPAGVVAGCSFGFGCLPSAGGGEFPSDGSWVRVVVCGQARLPRHVSAPVHAHDGIVGHGQAGLTQFFDLQPGVEIVPIVELAVWSCPSFTLLP